MKPIKMVGLSGSLRIGSYNSAALRAAAQLLPEGAELEILDLSALPFYNEDLDKSGALPQAVVDFKEKMLEADAVLMATPEYNYSVPPVLKNALDWASRDTRRPMVGKAGAILSASPGALGGARVQYHLRQVCLALNMNLVNRPEVFLSFVGQKVDEQGNLVDEKSKEMIARLLQELATLAGKQQ